MSIQGNWDRRISRRDFIGIGGMSAAALTLGSREASAKRKGPVGYGELVQEPGADIALPRGFRYRVISEEGSTLSNGAPVPGDHDGMAAFKGKGNTTILVRNHELRGTEQPRVEGSNPYDPAAPGGTTGIVVDNDSRREIRDYVTSSGTSTNCAGGATPWGTWLTCEETRDTNHGYVFEVNPTDPEDALSKTPIREMGFFSHEAVDIDPKTGVAYLTEDDFRGSIPDDPNAEVVADDTPPGTRVSFLYRFVPDVRARRPGDLQKGGTLQVMTLEEFANPNMDLANPGARFGVVWRDVNPEEPHEDAEALDAARFNRLEGAYFAGDTFWFDDTAGGEKRLGQVFRLIPGRVDEPGSDTLELFYEGTDANNMESPDNITVTPWGDLWFAEDGDGENRVMGITPEGEVYKFASNNLSEFAGPTFSPDGETFFVNIQTPGITFAIWGPFKKRDRARQRRMGVAAPPRELAPRVSAELADAAGRHGMSTLEAAAYARLGVPLA